ncbi:MAG: hypothetical protein HY646_16355 [Acidobacteria bacterium]|nr:hypothetical protein [Acidobacteriota bacterium]
MFTTPTSGLESAFRPLCYSVAALVVVLLSCCGPRRSASEERLSRIWMDVQEQFDRLAEFEVGFRAAAAASVNKTDAEKLRLAREALDQKYQLQLNLKRELKRFTKAAAAAPKSARLPYIKKVRAEMDKLAGIEAATLPSVKALALDKYEKELKAYREEKDAELRTVQ